MFFWYTGNGDAEFHFKKIRIVRISQFPAGSDMSDVGDKG